MPGIETSAYETNKKATTAVNQLTELLDWLYPDPSPNIFTLYDFRNRYKRTGLGELATRAIEQSQRINQTTNNFSQMGLCEFHIGLIYLYWGDNRGAVQQFKQARLQWSFTKNPIFICLAYFAEGVAQQLAFHYENTLRCYSKTEQNLDRIHFTPLSDNQNRFVHLLTSYLHARQNALHETLWGFATETYQVFPNPDDYCDQCVWYEVQHVFEDFLPQVEKGMLLLVNQQTTNHKYQEDELLIIGKDELIYGAVELQPIAPTPHRFRRIFLATSQINGTFTRNVAGKVTLSPQIRQVRVGLDEILGIVVGFWRKIEV